MQINITEKQMQSRIDFLEKRIALLEEYISLEMQRPFFERNAKHVGFYRMEKKIHSAVLEELKKLIYA